MTWLTAGEILGAVTVFDLCAGTAVYLAMATRTNASHRAAMAQMDRARAAENRRHADAMARITAEAKRRLS